MREPAKITETKVDLMLLGFETPDRTTSQMREEARRFVFAMGSDTHPSYWLSLVGSSGTGKTMLARMITRAFHKHFEHLKDEHRGRTQDRFLRHGGFLSWPMCVERMLDGDFGFVRQASEDWFLVLDDVGSESEKLRDLSVSKLFTILNARQDKFTILTCNYGLSEIAERMDVRIASRLLRHGGIVVDSTGTKDFNLRKIE